MEIISCNLCGSSDAEPVYQMADWSFDHLDDLYTYVRCKKCGLVYQNPRPTPEEILKYYPDDYECYPVPDPTRKTGKLLHAAIRYGMARRASNVTRYKDHGRLLDIGCATGVFLEAIIDTVGKEKRANWDLQGVEINAYAANIAREKGLKVWTGELKDFHFPDESFDVITLWDVFEHLHDPKGTLLEINRVLKKDGILVMRIPNLDCWDAKLFKKYWAGFEPPRHLFVFGRKTIADLLASSNLKIIHMDTKASRYLIFALSLRFYLSGKRVSLPVRKRIAKLLNHPAARMLSAPFFFFYGMVQRGPLLTIVSSKK